MAIIAPLDGVGGQFRLVLGAIHRVTGAVEDSYPCAGHVGDVAFFEENETPRNRQKGGDVRGDEVLADPEADHHGTALACHHDSIGVLAAQGR